MSKRHSGEFVNYATHTNSAAAAGAASTSAVPDSFASVLENSIVIVPTGSPIPQPESAPKEPDQVAKQAL